MPFTTPICLEAPLDDESGEWTTIEPLNYCSVRTGKNYVVPAGFKTNLASVPRAPFVYLAAGGAASAAAVVHDWLYGSGVKMKQIKDKAEADLVFYDAMLDTGVPQWRAWMMYQAVCLCGDSHFSRS